MSAYNTNFKQEMPPKGGYSNIHYERIPAQRIFGYKGAFIASCFSMLYAVHYYGRRQKYLMAKKTDYMDNLIAIEPLARAESDRAFLRQLRHNRNVERDLMKNVDGWEVGTLWGKPVYTHTPDDKIPAIHLREFYAHRPYKQMKEYARPNNEVGMEDCMSQTGI